MATLLIETDANTAAIEAFVEAATKHGHLGTGWTSPMINPMIKVQGIEVSDYGHSGEQ